MQQLHIKAGIIDAADLPFTCKTGKLAANKHLSLMYPSCAISVLFSRIFVCSLCEGVAYLLAMVERLRHDCHSLRHECGRKDQGASQGKLSIDWSLLWESSKGAADWGL